MHAYVYSWDNTGSETCAFLLNLLDTKNFDMGNFTSTYLEIFTGRENAKNVAVSLGKVERI